MSNATRFPTESPCRFELDSIQDNRPVQGPTKIIEGSVAWVALRMAEEAAGAGRLSLTEVAAVRNLVWHSRLPDKFRQPEQAGGFAQEPRF